jgi:hypothetical protein
MHRSRRVALHRRRSDGRSDGRPVDGRGRSRLTSSVTRPTALDASPFSLDRAARSPRRIVAGCFGLGKTLSNDLSCAETYRLGKRAQRFLSASRRSWWRRAGRLRCGLLRRAHTGPAGYLSAFCEGWARTRHSSRRVTGGRLLGESDEFERLRRAIDKADENRERHAQQRLPAPTA